jgi:hypothetical protein
VEKERIAPVQGYKPGIPWSMHLRAYAAYCNQHGEQKALLDLDGKNCRGGFHVEELDEFIPSWREELTEAYHLRKRVEALEQERDAASEFARCVMEEKPLPSGQYPHLGYCSGDRRKPAGTRGISCCCLPSMRRAEAALGDAVARRQPPCPVTQTTCERGCSSDCERARPTQEGDAP